MRWTSGRLSVLGGNAGIDEPYSLERDKRLICGVDEAPGKYRQSFVPDFALGDDYRFLYNPQETNRSCLQKLQVVPMCQDRQGKGYYTLSGF